LSIGPTRPLRNGTWTTSSLGEINKCSWQSWKNGEKRHITVPRFTKIAPKDGTTRGSSLRSSSQVIRVKLFGEGKLHSKWIGPYTVINTSSHGAITLQDNDGEYFKANGH